MTDTRVERIAKNVGADLDVVRKCIFHTSLVLGISSEEIEEALYDMLELSKPKIETHSNGSIVVSKEGLEQRHLDDLMKIDNGISRWIELGKNLRVGYTFPKYLGSKIRETILFGRQTKKTSKEYSKAPSIYGELKKLFSLSGKAIKGEEAIKLIRQHILPYPDEATTDLYSKIISSIDPNKEYRHIELFSKFYDLFHPEHPPRKQNNLTIHAFQPNRKEVYWITGPKDQVKNYIADLEERNLYQAFSAKIYPSEEGEDVGAWAEYSTSD